MDTARASPLTALTGPPRSRSRPSSSSSAIGGAAASANHAAIMAAAQAAGMPLSALDPSDPMASMNALLAAAQVSRRSFFLISNGKEYNLVMQIFCGLLRIYEF